MHGHRNFRLCILITAVNALYYNSGLKLNSYKINQHCVHTMAKNIYIHFKYLIVKIIAMGLTAVFVTMERKL